MEKLVKDALFELALRLGDDRLILGQRLSEWCGHGPILEEDIALTNFALDLIGQANNFLKFAGELEGQGRDADKMAFSRDIIDFKNLQLVEQVNGDFGMTIARQFIFDAWSVPLMERLQNSSDETLKGIAAKAYKEEQYHLRHSGGWVLRLGDGTEESHQRIQTSLNILWRFTDELFVRDQTITTLEKNKVIPDLSGVKNDWEKIITDTLKTATLLRPMPSKFPASGSRQGRHGEALGHLLSELQFLPRAYPGATW